MAKGITKKEQPKEQPAAPVTMTEEEFVLSQIPVDRFTTGGVTYLETCPICGDVGSFKVKDGHYECDSCHHAGTLRELAADLHIRHPEDAADPSARTEQIYTWTQQAQAPEMLAELEKLGISQQVAVEYNLVYKSHGTDPIKSILFFYTLPTEPGAVCQIDDMTPLIGNGSLVDDIRSGQIGWIKATEGKEHAFGWRAVDFSNNYLHIVSDPLDVLVMRSAGFKNVISAPGNYESTGGDDWITNDRLFMSKFSEILIVGARRLDGTIRLKNDLMRRLPASKIFSLSSAVYQQNGISHSSCGAVYARDLYDFYGEKFVNIKNQFFACGSKSIVPAEDVDWRSDKDLTYIPSGISEIDGIFGGGLQTARVILLSGEAGAGKSTFLSQIVINTIHAGFKTFMYSGELEPWQTKQWLAQQLAGKNGTMPRNLPGGYTVWDVMPNYRQRIDAFLRGNLFIYDQNAFISSTETSEEEYVLKQARLAVEQYGCRVVVIDNVLSIIDDIADGSEYLRQSEFMRKLMSFAKNLGVLVFLVAHTRKMNGQTFESSDDVYGSSALVKLADVVCCYARKKSLSASQRVLIVTKNRITGFLTTEQRPIILNFDQQTRRIFGTKPEILDYFGATELDAMSKPPKRRKTTKK